MYKNLILIFLTTLVGFKIVLLKDSKRRKLNYLFEGDLNLKQHLISHPHEQEHDKKIVFLGSSSLAGDLVPKFSTVTDYFNEFNPLIMAYNLGVFQGHFLDSLIYFKMAQKYRPKYAIVGINVDLFPFFAGGKLAINKYSTVQSYLSAEFVSFLKRESKKKFDPSEIVKQKFPRQLPLDSVINYNSWLFHLKDKIFGPTRDTAFYGHSGNKIADAVKNNNHTLKLIAALKKMADQSGTKLFFYFEPVFNPDHAYEKSRYHNFQEKIKMICLREGIPLFDYTHLLSEEAYYFRDYIHLQPEGYRALAFQIAQDFKKVYHD